MPVRKETQVDTAQVERVQRGLVDWYRVSGRDLPWRHTRDPYAVLVSEVMLQQTQVDRVIPRWHAWLREFPTLQALAEAPRAQVIRAWQGLGYNLRAVRLHEVARGAVDRFGGRQPDTLEALLSLKGIGRYTAGAVACFAFGQPVAFVDTNVRRVLGRVFLGLPLATASDARAVDAVAERALPTPEAYDWNQALMDLGATVCTVRRPACLVCPLLSECRAAPLMGAWTAERPRLLREARGEYDAAARRRSERTRFYRGRLVDAVRALRPGQAVALSDIHAGIERDADGPDAEWLGELARKLADDGLVALEGDPSARPGRLLLRLPE